jgi:alpha-D-ribose 1-methylphosphonate 5-triphosphate synthase subunit PhnI
MQAIHPGNFQAFMEVYEEKLIEARRRGDYEWPESELPQVLARMRAAIERGTANKDGPAFKATCKALGIKHTYQAINSFIRN